MNKLKYSLLLAIIVLMPAIAAEQEAGISPDNTILYMVDVMADDYRIEQAQTNEERAEIELDVADERLAEARLMAEKGKIKFLERAEQEHARIMNRLEKKVKQTLDDTEDELRLKMKYELRLQEHEERIDEMKLSVRERVSEANKERVENFFERMKAKGEEAAEQAQKVVEQARERAGDRLEELEERARAQLGVTDDEDVERRLELARKQWEKTLEIAKEKSNELVDDNEFEALIAQAKKYAEEGLYKESREAYARAKRYAAQKRNIFENCLSDSLEDCIAGNNTGNNTMNNGTKVYVPPRGLCTGNSEDDCNGTQINKTPDQLRDEFERHREELE